MVADKWITLAEEQERKDKELIERIKAGAETLRKMQERRSKEEYEEYQDWNLSLGE